MYITLPAYVPSSELLETTEMANLTNSSDYFWSYEYYMDYIDLIPVDARKLKANRCKYCCILFT